MSDIDAVATILHEDNSMPKCITEDDDDYDGDESWNSLSHRFHILIGERIF